MSETTTPDPVPGWMAQLTRYMALPDGQDGVTILQEEAGHLIYDDEVEALLRQIAAEQAATCEWREDRTGEFWHTGCGEAFFFDTYGPKENGQKFCAYCGKRLIEATSEVSS